MNRNCIAKSVQGKSHEKMGTPNMDSMGGVPGKYAAVADGVGSSSWGMLGSHYAVNEFCRILAKQENVDSIENEINKAAYYGEIFAKRLGINRHDMDTTLSAVMAVDDEIISINVGDSYCLCIYRNSEYIIHSLNKTKYDLAENETSSLWSTENIGTVERLGKPEEIKYILLFSDGMRAILDNLDLVVKNVFECENMNDLTKYLEDIFEFQKKPVYHDDQTLIVLTPDYLLGK